MFLWRCGVCGFTNEYDEAPDVCPKCGAPKEKFVKLTDEEAQKVYSSDRTNDIHMEIISLTMAIVELAQEGIDLDLDPPCVATFQKAIEKAWTIKQDCKAELAGHMNKGKW
ncbi:MAG: rubredoxin-like domain-containing protein [Anaerovoracaceae bacterium]|jgi:rubredoxin